MRDAVHARVDRWRALIALLVLWALIHHIYGTEALASPIETAQRIAAIYTCRHLRSFEPLRVGD